MGQRPRERYDWNSHGYMKVLCVTGSIVFHTRAGDFALEPGDRLEVDPGTEHAATVGATAYCASRPPQAKPSAHPARQLLLVLGEVARDHVQRELGQDRWRRLALEQKLKEHAHDALEIVVTEASGHAEAMATRALDGDVVAARRRARS